MVFKGRTIGTTLARISPLDKIEYVGLMTMAPFEASSDELKEILKLRRICN